MIQNKKNTDYFRIIVNISLVILSLCFIILVIKSYFFSSSDKPKRNFRVGDQINIPAFNFKAGKTNIFLILHSSCQYCVKSAYFYETLSKEVSDLDNTELTVFSSDADFQMKEFLIKSNLANLNVFTIDFAQIGFNATPVLMIVNDEGKIEDIWVGYLPPNKENEVRLKLNIPLKKDSFVDKEKIENLLKENPKPVIIDVRLRDAYHQKHLSGAINIPIDELSIRAVNEVSLSDKIIVHGYTETDSENAQKILLGQGFPIVHIFNDITWLNQ